MVHELTPALQKWLDESMAIVRHITHNYMRSKSTPKYLDEIELEAMAEIARWLNDWALAGLSKPKWTPATTAKFAWGHALEKIRALFSSVMKTPTEWANFDVRRSKLTGINLDDFDSEAEVFVSKELNQVDVIDNNNLKMEIEKVLSELPKDQATALRLFYLENESKKNIASELGVTIHVVSSLINKGMASIRKLHNSFVNYL